MNRVNCKYLCPACGSAMDYVFGAYVCNGCEKAFYMDYSTNEFIEAEE